MHPENATGISKLSHLGASSASCLVLIMSSRYDMETLQKNESKQVSKLHTVRAQTQAMLDDWNERNRAVGMDRFVPQTNGRQADKNGHHEPGRAYMPAQKLRERYLKCKYKVTLLTSILCSAGTSNKREYQVKRANMCTGLQTNQHLVRPQSWCISSYTRLRCEAYITRITFVGPNTSNKHLPRI